MKAQLNRPPPTPRAKRMTLGAVRSGVSKEPHRILLYGVGGVGKTTFAAEMPSPIFLDTQEGSSRLDVARFPRPTCWEDVLDAVAELETAEHSYRTLAIDLLDDLEALVFEHICARDGQANIEAYGYGKGYKVALNEWRGLLARLERMRRARGMAVVFIAHAQVKLFKNPEGDDYDRYSLQIHEQASGLLRGWCDTVLFARHETVLSKDARTKRVRGISTGARLLQTVETAAYHAKNRDGLPDTLPLDYAAFAEAVERGTPASAEALRDEIAVLASSCDADTQDKVQGAVDAAPDDVQRLVRVLNRLRERVQERGE
jgi:hypothetical protein